MAAPAAPMATALLQCNKLFIYRSKLYVFTYLWFMTKETFIYLYHNLLASQYYRWAIQEGLGADFSQPLININGCTLSNFSLFRSISDRVLPDPRVQKYHQLLQRQSRFVKKAIFSVAFFCVALRAIPTNPVRCIIPWPLNHGSVWTPTCIDFLKSTWCIF